MSVVDDKTGALIRAAVAAVKVARDGVSGGGRAAAYRAADVALQALGELELRLSPVLDLDARETAALCRPTRGELSGSTVAAARAAVAELRDCDLDYGAACRNADVVLRVLDAHDAVVAGPPLTDRELVVLCTLLDAGSHSVNNADDFGVVVGLVARGLAVAVPRSWGGVEFAATPAGRLAYESGVGRQVRES